MSGDFSFLKGNIYTIILCSLYGKDGNSGDKYGYEIAREIKERTDNRYEIKQPTLYAYLKKLEQQEQIESYWGTESNGGRRRYYKLTPKGRHDCEQFIAEWEYHKSVLSTLVDAPETPIDISQEQVTPLFGEKQKRTKTSASHKQELDEQDEIARRLNELLGTTDEDEPKLDTSDPSKLAQESLFDTVDYQAEPIVEEEPEEVYVEEEDVEPVQLYTDQDDSDYLGETSAEDEMRQKFDIKQDNAEDFMQDFDQRARVMSDTLTTPESNENYQHVLMKVLGDQLDEMRDYDSEQQEGAQKYYTDHPLALEDVADSLAKQGIRMRIYNHASSNYKSKTLMPLSSVLCKSSWITFAVAVLYFGILLFTSIANDNWRPFLITIAVLALVPIGLSIFALYDPSRKEKPRFVYKRMLIATSIMAVVLILFAWGISIITKIELSSYVAVANQILIPTGIALLFPAFIVVFNYFYKKY